MADETMRTQFGMVPKWVDEQITDGTAMRVYVRLARKYASETRDAFPEVSELAGELGIGERTVKRALATLREIGAVVVTRARQPDGYYGRNLYNLPLDEPPIPGEDGMTDHGPQMTPGPRDYRSSEDQSDVFAGHDQGPPGADQGPDLARGRETAAPTMDVTDNQGPDLAHPGGARFGPSEKQPDPENHPDKNQGGLSNQDPHEREGARAEQPPPPRIPVDLEDRSTWMCQEHLTVLADDPGADRPACGKCARVRQWAERKVTDRAQANSAAEGALRDQCTMHDSAGWRLDPDTGLPLEPAVRCDHTTPTAAVVATLASKAGPKPPAVSDETRAAAVAAVRAACCPKPSRTLPRRRVLQPDRDFTPASTGSPHA